jgi:aminoglycoside phosphotransferase (APT) family kinase protein
VDVETLRREGYAPDGPSFPAQGRDRVAFPLVTRHGARVLGKLYPTTEDAQATFANMQELWRSSFGARRRPPGLPKPIACLPELRVVIMERLEGARLVDGMADDVQAFDTAVRLAACLHGSDAKPARRRDARKIVRSIRRKAGDIGRLDAGFGRELSHVADRLEAATVGEAELVPSHGDLTPANVFLSRRGPALIDLDRFQAADPLRDLAYLGGWYCVRALRDEGRPDWGMVQRAISVYREERPLETDGQRLEFHMAAGLVRFAHGRLPRDPGFAAVLPRAAREAIAVLS